MRVEKGNAGSSWLAGQVGKVGWLVTLAGRQAGGREEECLRFVWSGREACLSLALLSSFVKCARNPKNKKKGTAL